MSGAVSASSLVMMGGMGVQAYGAFNNSKNARTAYEAQAQVNRNNAQIAQWQAEDALTRGQQAAVKVRMRTAQLKGTQRATMAANGVDLGVGSALQILSDTDQMGEIDANTTLDNSRKEAWALRNQAAGFTSESNLLQGRADAESPVFAGATSLLGSASKVSGNWAGSGMGRKAVDVPYG